jgi:hypothetical protein
MSIWPIKIAIVGLPPRGSGLPGSGKNPVKDHPFSAVPGQCAASDVQFDQ